MPITQDMLDDFDAKIRQQERHRDRERQKRHELWKAVLERYYPEYSFRKIGKVLGVDDSVLARFYRKMKLQETSNDTE